MHATEPLFPVYQGLQQSLKLHRKVQSMFSKHSAQTKKKLGNNRKRHQICRSWISGRNIPGGNEEVGRNTGGTVRNTSYRKMTNSPNIQKRTPTRNRAP